MNRRTFLTSLTVTGITGLAGCLDNFQDSNELETPDGLPSYEQWLPDEETLRFFHVDWLEFSNAQAEEVSPFGPAEPDGEQQSDEADVLTFLPSLALNELGTEVGLGLEPYDVLTKLIEDEEEDMGVTDITQVGDVLVIEGIYDLERIAEEVEEFELVDQRDEYDIYQRGSGDEEIELFFAVSEDVAIVSLIRPEASSSPEERVTKIMDAETDEIETLSNKSDAEQALTESGHGRYVYAGWGEESYPIGDIDGEVYYLSDRLPTDVDIQGVVCGLQVTEEREKAKAKLSIFFDEDSGELTEEELADVAGFSADNNSVTVDDGYAFVTGTWD